MKSCFESAAEGLRSFVLSIYTWVSRAFIKVSYLNGKSMIVKPPSREAFFIANSYVIQMFRASTTLLVLNMRLNSMYVFFVFCYYYNCMIA